ncbi:NAD-dependent epimerase/dehydratase family protein [Thermoplasmatales archaeon AK]|nr:NAD-dependent epimerase/dehydratase family protein [Thermoplasmatales archaeon AK]
MEEILVTGGNGFLGSHLVEKALQEGYNVTVIDDFSTMHNMNIPDGVRIIKRRIEDTQLDERFDYIVHMAARPSPEDYTLNPVETLLSNSIGTYNTLLLSKKYDSRFIYTSSSEVYGNSSVIPTPETYYGYVNPNGVRSCYDEGKRYSEALIMAFHRKYGLDVRIQRPFNVYGPRIRADGQYGRVIPRFISQALHQQEITLHGDGSQTRSFLYISDWVEATWRMITQHDLSGEVLNIGSEEEIRVLDLASMILELTGSSSKITYHPKREDDPPRRCPDITKANKLLGWKPKVYLREGLVKTISWFKEALN